MTERLVIQVSKQPDLNALHKFLVTQGIVVVDLIAVGNYLDSGPHVILVFEGAIPPGLAQRIVDKIAAQPAPPVATFLKFISPDGSTWKLGVNNAGEVKTVKVVPGV